MVYKELQPHPALRSYIAAYFFLQVESGGSSEELVIPDGTSGLMFVRNACFTRYCPADTAGRQQISGSFLFGQKTRAVHYAFDTPGLDCFGVKFQPHGLRAFTRLPASELTDTQVEAGQVLNASFSEWEARLYSAPDSAEKKELLDRFFISRLPDSPEAGLELIQKILTLIHRQQGQVEVASLLPAFQLNYKALERLFKKYAGLTPKAYCCLTRFNATLLHRNFHHHGRLAQLAYESGYFDQMHFIREVRQFTNLLPGEFYSSGLGQIGAHQRHLVEERLR